MEKLLCCLRDIAEIHAGYPFRERLEPDKSGNVRVVQLKDLTEWNRVDFSSAIRVCVKGTTELYCLRKGDLVFRSRGFITTSALMNEQADDVILAAPFLRIRIYDHSKVLPEYLNWYISSRPAQQFFRERQTGTSVNMVAATELAALPVAIPPLNIQRRIADIAALAEKQRQLELQLTEKRKIYIEALLLEQVGAAKTHKEHQDE